MPNTSATMCRLSRVDIFLSLIKICNSLIDGFSAQQQDKLRDDIHQQIDLGHRFLLALLYPTGIEVISEFNVYTYNSEEQKRIKSLLNKKLPTILAVSFFDDYAFPQADICIIGYSRLLDRVSYMTSSEKDKRLLKYIKSRRIAWRLSYKAVTVEEFIEELRKERQN